MANSKRASVSKAPPARSKQITENKYWKAPTCQYTGRLRTFRFK